MNGNKGRFRSVKYFVISRISGSMLEYADKFYCAKSSMKLWYLIIETLKNIPIVIKILLNKYAYIYHMEMPVTTKCSLRCKDCSNLMQYYKSPYDVDIELLLESVDKLMEVVDRISTYTLLGGEPLLYFNLSTLLNRLISEKKIEKIRIITNGTIVPKAPELINLLKDKKVYMYISNYGILSRKKTQLIDLLEEKGVKYFIFDEEVTWRDMGNIENRGKNESELHKQFVRCNSDCLSYFGGGCTIAQEVRMVLI